MYSSELISNSLLQSTKYAYLPLHSLSSCLPMAQRKDTLLTMKPLILLHSHSEHTSFPAAGGSLSPFQCIHQNREAAPLFLYAQLAIALSPSLHDKSYLLSVLNSPFTWPLPHYCSRQAFQGPITGFVSSHSWLLSILLSATHSLKPDLVP